MTAIRNTMQNLVEANWGDEWPRHGAFVDFGLRSQAHYEAIYYGLRDGQITPEQLDAALGDGEKLTTLARAARSNPLRDVLFHTSWDGLLCGREPSARALSEEEKLRRMLDRLVGEDRHDGRGR
jgi:hypothetical protein